MRAGDRGWLHESESNSLITEAYENKIFLTIIYISYNSRILVLNNKTLTQPAIVSLYANRKQGLELLHLPQVPKNILTLMAVH